MVLRYILLCIGETKNAVKVTVTKNLPQFWRRTNASFSFVVDGYYQYLQHDIDLKVFILFYFFANNDFDQQLL